MWGRRTRSNAKSCWSVNWHTTVTIHLSLQLHIISSRTLKASATMKLIIWETGSQKPQGCRDNWECETATANRHVGGEGSTTELNLAISTGEGGRRPHAPVLISDKRSKIIVRPGQDVSCAFVWSLTALFGCLQVFPLKNQCDCVCVCVKWIRV